MWSGDNRPETNNTLSCEVRGRRLLFSPLLLPLPLSLSAPPIFLSRPFYIHPRSSRAPRPSLAFYSHRSVRSYCHVKSGTRSEEEAHASKQASSFKYNHVVRRRRNSLSLSARSVYGMHCSRHLSAGRTHLDRPTDGATNGVSQPKLTFQSNDLLPLAHWVSEHAAFCAPASSRLVIWQRT